MVGWCFVSWLDQDDLGRFQNELSKTILERRVPSDFPTSLMKETLLSAAMRDNLLLKQLFLPTVTRILTHACIRNIHKQAHDKCTILFSALDNTFLWLGVSEKPSMCVWNLHGSQRWARGAVRNLFLSFSLCSARRPPLPLRDEILTLRMSLLPSTCSFLPSYSGFHISRLPPWTVPIYNSPWGPPFEIHPSAFSKTLAEKCTWKVAWEGVNNVSKKREAEASVTLDLRRMLGESSNWGRSTLNCNYS